MSRPVTSDVVIAGGGIIGLSIALELQQRGLSVTVVERDHSMRSASWAAGGMLAAHDPDNPAKLLPLSLLSLALYPAYLEKIRSASGHEVRVRTDRTLQQTHDLSDAFSATTFQEARSWIPSLAEARHRFVWLEEQSLDPRDLCHALPRAFLAARGNLLEGTTVLAVEESSSGVAVRTTREPIEGDVFINCCGAWAGELKLGGLPVEPVKGQAVTVALAPDRMRCVLRTPEFYVIPRGDGRATVGASVEHVGFDDAVQDDRIFSLLNKVSTLLPELKSAAHLESWAGLRPGTPDALPILGPDVRARCWHATGHYRNGVLLAPATARVMAQSIFGERTDVPMESFSPARFVGHEVSQAALAGSKSDRLG